MSSPDPPRNELTRAKKLQVIWIHVSHFLFFPLGWIGRQIQNGHILNISFVSPLKCMLRVSSTTYGKTIVILKCMAGYGPKFNDLLTIPLATFLLNAKTQAFLLLPNFDFKVESNN